MGQGSDGAEHPKLRLLSPGPTLRLNGILKEGMVGRVRNV